MARLRQKNTLGVCQTCGLWPSRAVSATATCPTGSTGDPVTVNLPAGAFYADTTENATELAQEEAQEQAEAGLSCEFPACTYEAISSYAQAGETAWKQYVYQLTTTSDPDDGLIENGILSDDGKRVLFSRTGFGPPSEQKGVWVVDTTSKPTAPPGLRGFWAGGMTVVGFTADTDYGPPAGKPAMSRAYDFIGAQGVVSNLTWRASDYATPEEASGIDRWVAISGNGETRVGVTSGGSYVIRCDGEPDFVLPGVGVFDQITAINYCGTRAVGYFEDNSVNGFWDKTGAGVWEFTERPIQGGWEADTVIMTHINGEGNIVYGTRTQDGTGDEFLVRWVDGVPTAYANPDGFTIGFVSEDGSTAVKAAIYDINEGSAPASIWDATNGFRNLYDLQSGVDFLFSIVGDPWVVNSMEVVGLSGNGNHLLIRVVGPSFDQIYALMYVYLG